MHINEFYTAQECEVVGYRIPEGMSVLYCSYLANRDPAVFPEPDSFKPERWTQQYVYNSIGILKLEGAIVTIKKTCRNAGDREKVWTFGGGPRQCIGRHLSSTLLRVRFFYTVIGGINFSGLYY